MINFEMSLWVRAQDPYLYAKLCYSSVSGPYWSLLGASVHYLDFFRYVGQLHTVLLAWSQDASPALDVNCEPLFPDITFHKDNDILTSLLTITEDKKAAVASLLQRICVGLVEVTERQLADFLPEGRYYNIDDADLRARLQHSHITNLVSEENFADLDFSLFKRRNSSLHHHSTINMMKRNKSVTSWLAKKPEEEQQHLLQLSSQKAATLRERHAMLQREAVRRKQDLLQEARQKKEAAEERKRQQVRCFVCVCVHFLKINLYKSCNLYQTEICTHSVTYVFNMYLFLLILYFSETGRHGGPQTTSRTVHHCCRHPGCAETVQDGQGAEISFERRASVPEVDS